MTAERKMRPARAQRKHSAADDLGEADNVLAFPGGEARRRIETSEARIRGRWGEVYRSVELFRRLLADASRGDRDTAMYCSMTQHALEQTLKRLVKMGVLHDAPTSPPPPRPAA